MYTVETYNCPGSAVYSSAWTQTPYFTYLYKNERNDQEYGREEVSSFSRLDLSHSHDASVPH